MNRLWGLLQFRHAGGGVDGWLALNRGSDIGRSSCSSDGNETEASTSSFGIENGVSVRGGAGEDGGVHLSTGDDGGVHRDGAEYAGAGVSGGSGGWQ